MTSIFECEYSCPMPLQPTYNQGVWGWRCSTIWNWVVNFMPQVRYFQRKCPELMCNRDKGYFPAIYQTVCMLLFSSTSKDCCMCNKWRLWVNMLMQSLYIRLLYLYVCSSIPVMCNGNHISCSAASWMFNSNQWWPEKCAPTFWRSLVRRVRKLIVVIIEKTVINWIHSFNERWFLKVTPD